MSSPTESAEFKAGHAPASKFGISFFFIYLFIYLTKQKT